MGAGILKPIPSEGRRQETPSFHHRNAFIPESQIIFMARFVPGKVIREFSLQGRKVIFRYPRKSDTDNFLRHINGLVAEKACIIVQKKATRKEEAEWLSKKMEELKKGTGIMVCVEVDGKFAGSAGIERKKPDSMKHVSTLGVGLHRDFRNMGIGPELIRTMEGLARKELKTKVLRLFYFQPNEHAKHVYEKLGFRETGRIPKGVTHYGKYHDQVMMVKVLK
jgi:RimJ/RimL family protein N-acetyltransferase